MDRSLKWRSIGLVAILLFCVVVVLPTFVGKTNLPRWFRAVSEDEINLGLDLQGGLYIVYNIDLDKAVDDLGSQIKRDLDTKYAADKDKPIVKTPANPVGAVTIVLPNPAKRAELEKLMSSDYGNTVTTRECPAPDPRDPKGAAYLCYRVSSSYADGIKATALANAVNTIRERIDEKGIAEPTVKEKGDDIIVELPGLDEESISRVKDIIARTAKLEFKVVDDGAKFMQDLYGHVDKDPDAKKEDIVAEVDQWTPEGGGGRHTDYYLIARDRDEQVTVADAKEYGCYNRNLEVVDGKVPCNVSGRRVIERYLAALATKDPKFRVPDDRQIGFEFEEPGNEAEDQRPYWRTYYLDRAVRLTGSAVSDAQASYDPNTNRPIVLVNFNSFGSRLFGDLTREVVGKKVATILDDRVKSAPIINGAILGGRASITMGGGDQQRQERDAADLVGVLKTGSLPAPLKEASSSQVGASLGRDAIEKTQVSFTIGILLVITIMIGIYRWSGTIAIGAVIVNVLMMLTAMTIFGATLTLPGIAAVVLTVGMAVDGNILIYERIRDELLLGKSVRGAVDLGFSRAFSAILDGQLTTAAAGWVLLQYGSGPIKGFAVMLLVGIGTTLFTNIWVSRLFFDWYIAKKKGQMATISI
ncbi:MAG: protein translocase subunit SecD [Kofleriaceae bacterium]